MSTVLPVLRRSAMQTAESCLYRYRAIWVDGVPDQSDLSMTGIAFHACAHRYIERLVSEQVPSDADEAKAAFVEGIAAALTPARLVSSVRAIFMRWAEHFELDLAAFLAAEEHQIGKTDQTFTPDLVYGRPTELEMPDFKTFWHPLTETQIRQDFQARWYIYNAMRIWPNFPKYVFTHVYVRYGTQVRVEFTPHDFQTFEDEIAAIEATITEAAARNEWPATAGKECAYCQLDCPLVDSPALIPQRVKASQAVTVGGWILAADRQVRLAKKALKAYCAAYGAVDVAGVEFNSRPVTVRTYPVNRVVAALTAAGVDKDAATLGAGSLTVSHSALAKLFKSYPSLEAALQPFKAESVQYRFGAKQAGVDEEEE